jgi:hypothetical protein
MIGQPARFAVRLAQTVGHAEKRFPVNIHGSLPINGLSISDSLRRVFMNFLFPLVASLALLVCAGCTNTSKAAAPVDRHNPESVLRAYFEAWARSDWSNQASFMDEKYAQMVPEPVDSIRVIEIQPSASTSLYERTYQVVFEIKVKGQGVSLQSGRYDWSYYLAWEAQRGTWLITNYGAG